MSDRRGRRHSRYDDRYYDDDYDYDYDFEHRPRNRSLGRKALDKLENAMGTLHLDNKSHHSRSSSRRHQSRDRYYPPSSHHHHTHRRYHSASPSRRSRSSHTSSSHRRASSRSRSRWERGIEAAVDAAAIEAIRLRREPGPWTGPKGQRLATAAVSAGVIGAATEKRKQEHSGGKLGTLGSAVGGLVVNRLVNGPRKEVRRYS